MTVDISVIITCYKKEEYLNECIDSVLLQTYQPKEIILVHDGCTEPAHHPSVTSIMKPRNKGVVSARHTGFTYSTGYFVLFLDGDDVLSPDYLEKMISLNTDIVYPDMFMWYVHGKYTGENKLISTPNLTPKNMHHHCQIPVTCLMTRKVYETLGGFKHIEVYEDWEFWLRAMAHGFKFKKAWCLLWYRQMPDTRNRQDLEMRKVVHKRIQDKYIVKRNKLCPVLSNSKT